MDAGHGDLNNRYAARDTVEIEVDSEFRNVSFAIAEDEDDAEIRNRYRPFLLSDSHAADDWITSLELSTALKMVKNEILDKGQDRLRILVLYGSLRTR